MIDKKTEDRIRRKLIKENSDKARKALEKIYGKDPYRALNRKSQLSRFGKVGKKK